jgi:hypothetical protein
MMIYSPITTEVPDQFVVRTQTILQPCAHMYVCTQHKYPLINHERNIHMST